MRRRKISNLILIWTRNVASPPTSPMYIKQKSKKIQFKSLSISHRLMSPANKFMKLKHPPLIMKILIKKLLKKSRLKMFKIRGCSQAKLRSQTVSNKSSRMRLRIPRGKKPEESSLVPTRPYLSSLSTLRAAIAICNSMPSNFRTLSRTKLT